MGAGSNGIIFNDLGAWIECNSMT